MARLAVFLALALPVVAAGCGNRAHRMHSAIAAGNLSAVKRLVAEDRSLANATWDDGALFVGEVPMLDWAIESRQVAIAQFLVRSGANVNALDPHGATPLHWLTWEWGDLPLMRTLLDAGARPDAADQYGATPLHEAAESGLFAAAQLLLGAGADPDAEDESGDTPLRKALLGGHTELARLLAAHSTKGVPVVCRMAGLCDGKALGAYLEQSAEGPNSYDKERLTPLHYAASNGCTDGAKLLLAKGAAVDAISSAGSTPLHLAVSHGSSGVASVLLAHGADPNASDGQGIAALHIAADQGDTELIGLLLRYGADVDAQDKFGKTPLIRLSFSDNRGPSVVRAAKLLLDRGASVNAQDCEGYTALHGAVTRRNRALVVCLLGRDADPRMPNCRGETPLDRANPLIERDLRSRP